MKPSKSNDNKEELYCNEGDKYLAPSESISLSK